MSFPASFDDLLARPLAPDPDWRFSLERPGGRRRAWMNMVLKDHQWLRFPWSRVRPVGEAGRLYRGGQPNPWQLKRYRDRGIATIVNLRGRRDDGTYALEQDACRRLGLDLVNFQVGSREPPRPDIIHNAAELFRRIRYPALVHCKAGADRAGMMSTLYLIFMEGWSVERAQHQALSLRFGHIRGSRAGVLDHFFETYTAFNAARPMPFLTWVDEVYEFETMRDAYRAGKAADVLNDMLLRE